jgi:AraC family mar-sox-rob regulon transcriptional activator
METHITTRSRVVRLLLMSPLDRVSADQVAARLRVSTSTLRRHLRSENTSYQLLLDAVRQHRCQKVLSRRWLPGKSIATDLGFRETNSFYRAFSKWTGKTYTQYKKELGSSSVTSL